MKKGPFSEENEIKLEGTCYYEGTQWRDDNGKVFEIKIIKHKE
jgi:hypothetical protein